MVAKTARAVFDGAVLRPTEPLDLAPDTLVELTIETVAPTPPPSERDTQDPETSFFHVARSLKLEGPSDWSKNLDAYLYGEQARRDG